MFPHDFQDKILYEVQQKERKKCKKKKKKRDIRRWKEESESIFEATNLENQVSRTSGS